MIDFNSKMNELEKILWIINESDPSYLKDLINQANQKKQKYNVKTLQEMISFFSKKNDEQNPPNLPAKQKTETPTDTTTKSTTEIANQDTNYKEKINEKNEEITKIRKDKENQINKLKEQITEKLKKKNEKVSNLEKEIKDLEKQILFETATKEVEQTDKTQEKITQNKSKRDKVLKKRNSINEVIKTQNQSINEKTEQIKEAMEKIKTKESEIENLKKNLANFTKERNEEISKRNKERKKEEEEEEESNAITSKKFDYFFKPYLSVPGENPNYILSSLSISLMDTLFEEGWPMENIHHFTEENNLLRIGFLGDFSSGKTFIINYLFGTNFPNNPTTGINYIQHKEYESIQFIDSPGLRHPIPSPTMPQSELNEIKRRDQFIKEYILENSTIVIYVVKNFNISTQKELNKIKKKFLQHKKSTNKKMIIIHNMRDIENEEMYNNYIQTQLKTTMCNDKRMKMENKVIYEYIGLDDKELTCKVIHLVLSPQCFFKEITTFLYNEIKKTPHEHVRSFIGDLKHFFQLFGVNEEKIEFNENKLKISEEAKDNLTQRFCQKENLKSQSTISFSVNDNNLIIDSKKEKDLIYWKHFDSITPSFSVYKNKDNDMVIQVEISNLEYVEIRKEIYNDYTKLYIYGIKEDNNQVEYIQSNRQEGQFQLNLKIPKQFGILSNRKSEKYVEGILILVYSIIKN